MANVFRQVKGPFILVNNDNQFEQANMGAKNHAILMPDGEKFQHPLLATPKGCVFF